MSKRNRDTRTNKGKLRCPLCHAFAGFPANPQHFGLPFEPSWLSEPGDLTQCDHCLAMLEYGGELKSLTLQPAPRKRVESFNELSRVDYREPSLPELIEYVKKHRQMPRRPHNNTVGRRSPLSAVRTTISIPLCGAERECKWKAPASDR